MNRTSKILAIVIVICLVFAVAASAAIQYLTGLRLGTGGLLVKGGNVTVQTTGEVTKALISATYGLTIPIINETTAARTVAATDFGNLIVCSYAGATTITLPDPTATYAAVGATLYVTQSVDQNLTIVGGSTANNNQIIADGVLTTDNVAFSTTSHKIGAMAKITCISATKWLITDASSCAMTVEAAD